MAKKKKYKTINKYPPKRAVNSKVKLDQLPPLTSNTNTNEYLTDFLPRQVDLDHPIVEGVKIDREAYLDEKIHSGVQIPYFLPYFDNLQTLNTTPEMVYAFRRMLNFPEINAGFYNVLLAVMSLTLKIHPVDKKNKRDMEIAKFVEWNLKHRVRGGVPELVHNVLAHAGMDGCSVNEKIWEIQKEDPYKGKRVLKAIKPKDVIQDLVLELDPFRNIIGVKALRYNDGKVFSPNDFLIYSRLALFDNPLGISWLRAAYQPYWFLDAATKIRFQAMEKRALPVLIGEADATQQLALQNALSRIKSQNWLTVPRETKVQALDIAGQSSEIFEKFCRDQQTRILMALNGAELQSMSSGANNPRGDSSIHENTMELRTWYNSASFCTVLNDRDRGLIVDMVRGNFSGVSEFPYATMSGIDDSELGASMVIDQGLKELGWEHSIDDLIERYGRPLPMDEDDRLQNPELQQAVVQHHLDVAATEAANSGGGGGSGGSGGGSSGKKPKTSKQTSVSNTDSENKEKADLRKYLGPRGGKWLIGEAGKKIHDNSR